LYRTISESPESIELLDDLDAMILPYEGKIEVHEPQILLVRELLSAAGQLTEGALLIKNPYDAESYEFADSAIETFASAKYHALANVSRLLGATKVRFVEAKVENGKSSWVAKALAHFPGGRGDVDVRREVTKKLEDHLEGEMAFPGSAPAVDDAMVYLRRRNLSGDQQMRDLIDLRTGSNPIRDYRMTVSGLQESASNFTAALKLINAGGIEVVDLGASFSATTESVKSITITTEITF
jgi:hypothetical protein